MFRPQSRGGQEIRHFAGVAFCHLCGSGGSGGHRFHLCEGASGIDIFEVVTTATLALGKLTYAVGSGDKEAHDAGGAIGAGDAEAVVTFVGIQGNNVVNVLDGDVI